jgi:hypothetical protein
MHVKEEASGGMLSFRCSLNCMPGRLAANSILPPNIYPLNFAVDDSGVTRNVLYAIPAHPAYDAGLCDTFRHL